MDDAEDERNDHVRQDSDTLENETLSGFEESTAAGQYDNDVLRLRKALSNEKFSPTIMQYDAELVDRMSVSIEMEEEALSKAPPSTDPVATLSNDLHWTSLNRAKYLMRAYLRTRLWKIEQHVMHILMPENGLYERLSPAERTYAEKYTGIMDDHLQSTALSRMPPRFSSLVQQMSPEDELAADAQERVFDMIPEPNLDTFVFCRPLEDIGNFEVDGDAYELTAMKTYMMRYRIVQRLIENKQMELL
mmetsp:Transcript_29338/g.56307  ORF Transcript_29338/g.56307 Transcript_29338/m.56307 type:complete len:247 (+) Transcript_29338:59-799(+)